jgi:ribosome maturation factor RimP|tara:strand:+ start:59 stop:271 length:213 start_codon:yes stop_codon:yes gene_type:complete
VIQKLTQFLGREVEIWTTENVEPWMGIVKDVQVDFIVLMIDELETYLSTRNIVAFRLSEEEQGESKDSDA